MNAVKVPHVTRMQTVSTLMNPSTAHAWQDILAMERTVQVHKFHSFDLSDVRFLHADINECLQEDACQPHSTCMNYLGTFSCTCIEGFSANDSHSCEGKASIFIHTICWLHPCIQSLHFPRH